MKATHQTAFWPARVALLVVLSLVLCSCTHYDITTRNGDVIRARTKPKLNEQGYYIFEDLAGKQSMLNPMRVKQIEAVRRGSKTKREF